MTERYQIIKYMQQQATQGASKYRTARTQMR